MRIMTGRASLLLYRFMEVRDIHSRFFLMTACAEIICSFESDLRVIRGMGTVAAHAFPLIGHWMPVGGGRRVGEKGPAKADGLHEYDSPGPIQR